jgi:hypothetical protein
VTAPVAHDAGQGAFYSLTHTRARAQGEFYMIIDVTECTGRPTLLSLVAASVARSLEEQVPPIPMSPHNRPRPCPVPLPRS